MKIVSVDKVYLYPEHVEELKKIGEVTIYNSVPEKKEGIERIKDAEIVIDNWFPMPEDVILSSPKLKHICVAAIGYEWVDLKQARKQNIIVSNSPRYCTNAVAEHTVGLMLSVSRLALNAIDDIRRGIWGPTKYRGTELSGKTLGIIGFGSIGQQVAKVCQSGFGMKILFVDSHSQEQEWKNLLKHSDIISINLPLIDKTRGLIGKKEIELMKQGVVLVNTGRGAVIDEMELIKNLKSGKIFAVGLDVLAKEPMDGKHQLFSLPNVIITPHIAFNTQESQHNLSQIIVQNIKAFISGKPQNVVS